MNRWLSWGLLVVAYATYGQLLHTSEVRPLIWTITLVLVLLKAGVLTLLWKPVRQFLLMGFQSDMGYVIMVLAIASMAVLAVAQFRSFAYVLVLVATALLVRVDCLVDGMSDRRAFFVLTVLPLIGLGISWLPQILFQGAEIGEWPAP